MSIQLTRKLNLISIMTKNIIVFIINDKRLKTYDVHFLNMKIIDRKRHIRYFNEFFLTSNITHERVVRDMSWLKLINSNINWIDEFLKWRFDINTFMSIVCKLRDIKLKNIIKKINNKSSTMFCLFIKSIFHHAKFVHSKRWVNIAIAMTYVDEISMNSILMTWRSWEHFFSKAQTYKFSTHTFYDHVIDLKKYK